MIDDAAVAGVNVALNLVLIPRFDLLGAAYATTISYLLLNLLYSGQLYRRTGVHPFSRSLVVPGVAGGSVILLLVSISDSIESVSPLALVGLIGGSLVVYGVAVVRFGIQPEEVRLLLSIEERFGVDLGPLKRVLRWFM
jgi:O-antigen/teichoic acid export membrane protein